MSVQELYGKTDFGCFDWELAMRYTQDDSEILESGVPLVDNIEPLPDKEGQKSYSSTSKFLIYNQEHEVIGIYGVGRDVTAQIKLEEERERRLLSRQMFDAVIEADLNEDQILRVEGAAWVKRLGLAKYRTFTETITSLRTGTLPRVLTHVAPNRSHASRTPFDLFFTFH